MAYDIEPNNRFFQANRRIIESEIAPANTVTFVSEVDLTEVQQLRKAGGEGRPSYTALVVKAVALAIRAFPYANRRVTRSWLPLAPPRLQRFHEVDVAVAIERDVPGSEATAFIDVIRRADEKDLSQITQSLRNLANSDEQSNEQWRTFRGIIQRFPGWLAGLLIRMPRWFPGMWARYRGGAVLVSSPAKYGVDCVMTTWPWPVGVSFGLVKERAIVRGGEVVAAPTFNLVLNFDRRVMAGAQAARFFQHIVELLTHARQHLLPALSQPISTRTADARNAA